MSKKIIQLIKKYQVTNNNAFIQLKNIITTNTNYKTYNKTLLCKPFSNIFNLFVRFLLEISSCFFSTFSFITFIVK